MKSDYSVSRQFIDLVTQQERIRPALEEAIEKVLNHGRYIMGPEVMQLEAELRKFAGVKHTLTCANGTDALTLVLMAWGVGEGDAVFVPSFTYVASAEAPAQLGATPFFVDVDEDTFNIDPESLKQAITDCRKMGLKPSVVVAVDLFGHPADVDALTNVAHENKVKILVDGAQSFGATTQGRRVGSLGDASTTSFFPAKPLGCYGDGGAVFTEDDETAEIVASLRLHGRGSDKYDNVRIGLNSRLDTLQAAILLEKLKIFPDELQSRAKAAKIYSDGLRHVFKVPETRQGVTSAWAQYTLSVENRQSLIDNLNLHGIPYVIYYPIPLSLQSGYKHFPKVTTGVKVSEALAGRVVSLPMHGYLDENFQEQIISAALK